MTPRIDVCAVCEEMRQNAQSSITEEKVLVMTKFKQIKSAQDECGFYKSVIISAKEEYDFLL